MGKIRTGADFILQGKNELGGPFQGAGSTLDRFKNFALNPATLAVAAFTAASTAAIAITGKLARGVVDLTNEHSKLGDELGKTAKRLGTNVEMLDALGFAVEREGGNAASLTTAYRTLARAAVEARDGQAEYLDVFQSLNVQVTDSEGNLRDLSDLFIDVADSISKTENQTEALGLAQQAEALGGIMGTDLTDASEKYQDSLTNLRFAWKGVQNEIAETALPILTKVVDSITSFVAANRQQIDEMMGRVGEGVELFISRLLPWIEGKGKTALTYFTDLSRKVLDTAAGLKLMAGELPDTEIGFTTRALKVMTDVLKEIAQTHPTVRRALEALEVAEQAGAAQRAIEDATAAYKDMGEDVHNLAVLHEILTQAIEASGDAPNEVLVQLRDRYADLLAAEVEAREAIDESSESSKAAAENMAALTAAVEAYRVAWRLTGSPTRRLARPRRRSFHRSRSSPSRKLRRSRSRSSPSGNRNCRSRRNSRSSRRR
jgi:hypothetical protein